MTCVEEEDEDEDEVTGGYCVRGVVSLEQENGSRVCLLRTAKSPSSGCQDYPICVKTVDL